VPAEAFGYAACRGRRLRMPTLHEVIREVASRFELAYKQTDDDAFVLEVAFEDRRTQVVAVAIAEDDYGETWVTVHSMIGAIVDLDAEALLEANAATGYAFVATSDGEAFVCAQMPLSIVDAELCKAMIWSVASFADSIEEEVFGDDEG
jgi:hypothetical protein